MKPYKMYLWSIASFMIFLVLTLPIFSTSVFANIQSTSASGSEGLNGFGRTYDSVNISVFDDQQITADKVTIGTNQFTECDPALGGTSCFYFIPFTSLPIGMQTFTVTAQEASGSSTKTGTFYVDNNTPVVSINSLQQSGGIINLSYDVNLGSVSTQCPGVNSVSITVSGASVYSKQINQNPDNCDYSDTVQFSIPTGGLATTCVIATDNLQQSGRACASQYLDSIPPDVNNVGIFRNDTQISWISALPQQVLIEAYIKDDNVVNGQYAVSASSIRANLSNLIDIPAYKSLYSNIPPTIPYDNTTGLAIWNTTISLSQLSAGSVDLTFSADDASGNHMQKTVSVPLQFDNSPPSIVSIKTDKCIGDTCYVKGKDNYQNNLAIVVNEADSGISFGNIFLDMSSFGLSTTTTTAGSSVTSSIFRVEGCNPGASGTWICTASFNFTLSGSGTQLPINVVAPSQDDAGNLAVGNTKATFILDNEVPTASADSINITAVSETGRANYFKSGDTLDIVANFSHSLMGLSATADFSQAVANGDTAAPGSCNYDASSHQTTCEWVETSPIKFGPLNTSINFTVSDLIGNNVTIQKNISILAIPNQNYTFWRTYLVNASPIDAATAQIMPDPGYPVYFSVPLITDYGARILSLDVVGCTSGISGRDVSPYIANSGLMPDVINNYGYGINAVPCGEPGSPTGIEGYSDYCTGLTRGSVPPLSLRYYLTNQPAPNSSILINCTLKINSQYGGAVYNETHVAQLQFDFYNNGFGDPSQAVKSKIGETKDWLNSKYGSTIELLNKIFTLIQTICNILYTAVLAIELVVTVFHVLGIVITGSGETCDASGVCGVTGTGGALRAMGFGQCNSAGALQGSVKGLYNLLDWACFIGDCRLLERIPRIGPAISDWKNTLNKFLTASTFGKAIGGATLTGYTSGIQAVQTTPQVSFPTLDALAQKSIVWAALDLCIPGIISGLQRYRQIQCKYVWCLQQSPKNNVPLNVCENMLHYDTCVYVAGEVFNLIPWFVLWDQFWSTIKNAINNLLGTISLAFTATCALFCKPTSAGTALAYVCDANEGVKMILSLYDQISGMLNTQPWNNAWPQDYCDLVQ